MYTFLRSLAVAGASVSFATILPGSLRATAPVPPPRAAFLVQNDRSTPITVYVQRDGFDQRLGTVAAYGTMKLPVPKVIAWDRSEVRIFVHPKGGFDVATPDVTVRPGSEIGVLVPPAGELASAPAAEPAMRDPDPASTATSVTVRNDGEGKVEVYAEEGQFDTPLGSVSPHATATLRIPGWLVNREGVVLEADPQDGMGFHTPPMRIHKGHHLGMIVPAL
jgi:hypothetical protein